MCCGTFHWVIVFTPDHSEFLNRNVITLRLWRRGDFECWTSASLYHKHSSAAEFHFIWNPNSSSLVRAKAQFCVVGFSSLLICCCLLDWWINSQVGHWLLWRWDQECSLSVWVSSLSLHRVIHSPLLKITVEEWKGLFRVCLCCRPRVCSP